MRITTGTDILKITRLFSNSGRVDWDDPFIKKAFTEQERNQGREREDEKVRAQYFAVRFAGKEAVFKAISGCGLGFEPRDIEVVDGVYGRPEIVIRGDTKEKLDRFLAECGERLSIDVSLSFESEYAIAAATALFEKI
ncbi:MAG: 4'-phosphopantetheinyl transferase superfamily protein [Treponema sp.]|jgi:holo-[acyl-carrier protein] synthase|nr:4'-phosphopantetheinyl transferase superfamily protein [Treponema sp.]